MNQNKDDFAMSHSRSLSLALIVSAYYGTEQTVRKFIV